MAITVTSSTRKVGPKTPSKGGVGAAVQRITAWSFSRWKDWMNCPQFAKFKHVLRIAIPEEDDSPALVRGRDMHEEAEGYLLKKLKTLHADLLAFKEEFDACRKSKIKWEVEQEWAFDINWRRVSWFAKETWLRIKMDAAQYNQQARHVRVIDYKTGKKYPDDHEKQAELYAIGAMLMFPEALSVTVEFWYFDQSDIVDYQFKTADIEKMKTIWLKRVEPMLLDTKFEARINTSCRWCAYSKTKGGPCKLA